jgi:hypothetical protein
MSAIRVILMLVLATAIPEARAASSDSLFSGFLHAWIATERPTLSGRHEIGHMPIAVSINGIEQALDVALHAICEQHDVRRALDWWLESGYEGYTDGSAESQNFVQMVANLICNIAERASKLHFQSIPEFSAATTEVSSMRRKLEKHDWITCIRDAVHHDAKEDIRRFCVGFRLEDFLSRIPNPYDLIEHYKRRSDLTQNPEKDPPRLVTAVSDAGKIYQHPLEDERDFSKGLQRLREVDVASDKDINLYLLGTLPIITEPGIAVEVLRRSPQYTPSEYTQIEDARSIAVLATRAAVVFVATNGIDRSCDLSWPVSMVKAALTIAGHGENTNPVTIYTTFRALLREGMGGWEGLANTATVARSTWFPGCGYHSSEGVKTSPKVYAWPHSEDVRMGRALEWQCEGPDPYRHHKLSHLQLGPYPAIEIVRFSGEEKCNQVVRIPQAFTDSECSWSRPCGWQETDLNSQQEWMRWPLRRCPKYILAMAIVHSSKKNKYKAVRFGRRFNQKYDPKYALALDQEFEQEGPCTLTTQRGSRKIDVQQAKTLVDGDGSGGYNSVMVMYWQVW